MQALVARPSLETQCAIVAEIESEQVLLSANRELGRRREAKVKATIDRFCACVLTPDSVPSQGPLTDGDALR